MSPPAANPSRTLSAQPCFFLHFGFRFVLVSKLPLGEEGIYRLLRGAFPQEPWPLGDLVSFLCV